MFVRFCQVSSRTVKYNTTSISRHFARAGRFNEEISHENEVPLVLKNGDIKFPSMRVVWIDETTKESKWKIMNRADALNFAKELKTDIIVGE